MVRAHRWGWSVVTAASGTVLIAVGAFWLSFMALADLARRSGITAEQAWVWPLLVDGLIVVATIAVVALDQAARAWYPWALLIAGAVISVIANATHALVAADPAVPGILAASVASVPPLVLVASTHLTVVLIRSTHPPRTVTAEQTTTAAPRRLSNPDPVNKTHSAKPASPVSAVSHAHALPSDSASKPTTAPPAEKELPDPREPQAAPAAQAAPGEGQVEPIPPRVEAARLRERGWSNRKIAAHLHVHPSTVGRWLPRTNQPSVQPSEERTS